MQFSAVGVPRRARFRPILIGFLSAVAVAQVIAMTLLMQSQVRSAQARVALDTSTRLAAARCHEFPIHRGVNVCGLAAASRQVTEVIENSFPLATAANDSGQNSVLPVGYSAGRARDMHSTASR